MFSLLGLLIMITMAATPMATEIHAGAKIHRGLVHDDYIDCVVHEIGGMAVADHQQGTSKKNEKRLFSCSAKNFGPTVMLDGDYDEFFSTSTTNKDYKILSGVSTMNIPTNLISGSLSVDLNDPLAAKAITVQLSGKKRRLNSNQGTVGNAKNRGSYGVLVVRVSDGHGNSPTYNAREISDSIFNGYVSLATGYHTCSNNQLFFYPVKGGAHVVRGVVDVVVPEDLSIGSYDSTVCVNAADSALSTSTYDVGNDHTYTMYICPSVVEFGQAAGVAQMGGTKSWFSDTWGSLPFVQMHELGHNLMFFHSAEGNMEYGDPTDFMGGAFEHKKDWGRICLNAAKTYLTGWYSEYHVNIDPMLDPYIGRLVDVNSVYRGDAKEDQDDLVVRIGSTGEKTLYFMLHRLEGITSHMVSEYIPTHANRVNIVSQAFDQGVPSKAVGHLASGEEYIQNNWAGTGQSLHIKVCSIAEESADGGAKVIVYLEGENHANCEMDNISPPSPSPSKHATPSHEKEEACIDSPLKMILPNGTKRGCTWVAKAKTLERCLVSGVASHCPLTCGTCVECVDSSRRFQMPFGDMKFCSWVNRNKTEQRCSVKDVANTCRATCGTCV